MREYFKVEMEAKESVDLHLHTNFLYLDIYLNIQNRFLFCVLHLHFDLLVAALL